MIRLVIVTAVFVLAWVFQGHLPVWIRHDLRDAACFIAMCALYANFLPKSTEIDQDARSLNPKLVGPVHDFYIWYIDMIAFCAFNFRVELPSMEFQWFGFARKAKHAVRNWRQDRADRQTRLRMRLRKGDPDGC